MNIVQSELGISESAKLIALGQNEQSLHEIEMLKSRIQNLEAKIQELNAIQLVPLANPEKNPFKDEYNSEIQLSIKKKNENINSIVSHLTFLNSRMKRIESKHRDVINSNLAAFTELFSMIFNKKLHSACKEDLLEQIIRTFLDTHEYTLEQRNLFQQILFAAAKAFKRGVLPKHMNQFETIVALAKSDPAIGSITQEQIRINIVHIRNTLNHNPNLGYMADIYDTLYEAAQNENNYDNAKISELPTKRPKAG